MEVTQTYKFIYKPLSGSNVEVTTKGNMGSGVMVDKQPCGNITRIVDAATGDEKINVNLFYYPLYGSSAKVEDKIIIKNGSGADLNLLIAKQRYDIGNPSAPDYLMDAQLMASEQTYRADVAIQNGSGSPLANDKFSLKTNLGLNRVGRRVRRPMGKPAAPGEATELIYDVKVSVYEEGAEAKGFPDDMRMVVIGGSMTN